MEQGSELILALVLIINHLLAIIGVTGGLKGLIWGEKDIPSIGIGPWKASAALVLSWGVGAAIVALGYQIGWGLPIPADFPTPAAWVGAVWMFISGFANIFRNAAFRPTVVVSSAATKVK